MKQVCKKFTLIEVLVAMGVFMVGVAPLLGVLASSTRIYQSQVNTAKVSDLVRKKIMEYRVLSNISTQDTFITDVDFPTLRYKVTSSEDVGTDHAFFEVVTISVLSSDAATSADNLQAFTEADADNFTFLKVIDE